MTTYFVCKPPDPPLLLRRTNFVDEAFLKGKWQPTKVIINYMAGHDDNVDGPISEKAARVAVPAAFV